MVNYSPSYQYYAYYPYSTSGLSHLGTSSSKGSITANETSDASGTQAVNGVRVANATRAVSANTSASDFFASGISAFTPAADQSTAANFNASDLQVGKATISRTDASDVTFSLERQMGLAEITLNAASDIFIAEDATLNTTDGVATNVTTSDATTGLLRSGKHYKIMQTGSTVSTISSTSGSSWHCNFTGFTAGSMQSVSFPSARTYTLAVGDIYYSDGFVSHASTHLNSTSGKTPIGLVGYLGKNYWTEYNTGSGHGGHALVMCLRNIGASGVSTNLGTAYQWKTANTDDGRTKVNTSSLIINSYNQSYGSGYTETNALNNSEHPAAQAAKGYTTLTAPTSKSTGWFLPTAGQYYAVMHNYGYPSSGWNIFNFVSNSQTVSAAVNSAIATAANGTGYTEFFQGVNGSAWTSSVYDSTYVLNLDSGVDDSHGSGSVRFGGYGTYGERTSVNPVRAFLAF